MNHTTKYTSEDDDDDDDDEATRNTWKKHTRNSAAFATSGIKHSLSVFFCSATKRSLYFTGHQQHTAIYGLRSIRGLGEAKSPASRECVDDDE
jgi:hypothetical protein